MISQFNLQSVKTLRLSFVFNGNIFRHHRRIVLLAIQDEAYRYGRYYKYVLRRLNIDLRRIKLSYRSSLAVIGYVGRRKPYWIRYMSRPQKRGPSYASARIPLGRGEGITRFLREGLLLFQVTTISVKDMILLVLTSVRCSRHSNHKKAYLL